MSLKYTEVTFSILRLIFLMYVRTIQRMNDGVQEAIKKLQFVILTHLCPWNEVKVIKPGVNL